MAFFPMFIDLSKQPVLIIGGGKVAFRKLQKLIPYEAEITVIAPRILPEIRNTSNIVCINREFTEEDLSLNPVMVLAATNCQELNLKISTLCKERRIPINVADDIEKCSFLFPALVQQGSFCAGFCTGGASPTAAAYYKKRFQEILPDNIDTILLWLESKRSELKEKIPIQAKRAAVFKKLFEACLEKGGPLSEEEFEQQTKISPVGRVALVGAGCGKADLITVRGLRLLQQCEAVVYDDLIDFELLKEVPETALQIYMGKRSNTPSASQQEISQKLIELALEGKNVVRLKGGDPYLFGRGGEEMQALRAAKIPCLEVPGIPSAIAIPAEAGIPVTHRKISQGLHIITAHTADTKDGLPSNFDVLAKLSGTLVFLMGLKQLPEIVRRLIANGKSGSTPAAVISGGNSPNPSVVRASLSQIEQEVKRANVLPPAIILIGEVAALDLNHGTKLLNNVKIGITGTKEVALKQQAAFCALGAKVSWLSSSVVKDRHIKIDLQLLNRKPCWAVFTSSNGVKSFFRQVEKASLDLTKITFAVIGPATKKTLAQYGIKASLCPEEFTSEALARALVSAVNPKENIILLRSSAGSPILSELPHQAGLNVIDIPIYDLETKDTKPESLQEINYLTFASAGGVISFFETYKKIPGHITCVCIGKVTANKLQAYTENKILIAAEALTESMVQTIIEDYTGRA